VIIHVTNALSRASKTASCRSIESRDQPDGPPMRNRNARAGEVTSFSAKWPAASRSAR
jgi:hypothetical protein